MGGGFAPRFLVEAVFLVLLATAAGLADLKTVWIILLMVVAWLLVTAIEWLAWRSETRSHAPPARALEEPELEPADAWDLDEILVPLPEEESDLVEPPGESRTTVLPPDEPKDEASAL